ncbi:MAG: class I tRNA ligase family protein, partial [Marinirhabdus sp.]
LFLCATDEHGTPAELAAAKAGKPVADYCAEMWEVQDKLGKEGLRGKGGNILRKMEQVEGQLIDKGFNQRTLEQMLNLKYELLKLDTADFEQGQESKRESRANRRDYNNLLRLSPEETKKYFNVTEILNREALPLRPRFRQKVQTYFKKDDG